MTWAWVAATVAGQALGELTMARDRQLAFDARGPATAQFSLDGEGEQGDELRELANDLFVWRNRELLFRGRLGAVDDDLNADRHAVSWSAVDYRGLLAARFIPQDWTYETTLQGDIAWNLIDWAQQESIFGATVGGGSLGITRGPERPAAIARTEVVEADETFDSVLDRFQDYETGFEWWIDPQLRFQCATWRGVDHADFPLAWGTSLLSLKRTVDTGLYANYVRLRGGKPEDDPDAPELVSDRWSPGLATGQHREGRIMRAVQNHDLKARMAVAAAADQLLADSLSPPAVYSCTLAPELWNGPSDCWLGDTLPLIVRSGRLRIAETARVSQLDISIDDDGNEQISLVVGHG